MGNCCATPSREFDTHLPERRNAIAYPANNPGYPSRAVDPRRHGQIYWERRARERGYAGPDVPYGSGRGENRSEMNREQAGMSSRVQHSDSTGPEAASGLPSLNQDRWKDEDIRSEPVEEHASTDRGLTSRQNTNPNPAASAASSHYNFHEDRHADCPTTSNKTLRSRVSLVSDDTNGESFMGQPPSDMRCQ
jgi:hypothetical protein